jgi:hypothetical protein
MMRVNGKEYARKTVSLFQSASAIKYKNMEKPAGNGRFFVDSITFAVIVRKILIDSTFELVLNEVIYKNFMRNS